MAMTIKPPEMERRPSSEFSLLADTHPPPPEPTPEKTFKAFAIYCAAATQRFLSNNSMQMAAAVAFYTFFSLFPLSILIILGYDLFADVGQEQLTRVIGTFFPVSPETLAETINRVAERWNPGATGPLAFVGLIWASTAVFATLRKGINASWNIWIPRPFLKERVIDLSVTAGAGVLFMLLLFTTSFLRSFEEGEGVFGGPIWQSALSLVITVTAFSFLYRFMPNRPGVRFGDVLFGAAVAALAFEIAKSVFFFYTNQRGDLSQVYGSLTSVMLLLAWLYISAALVLIGALTAAIYSRLIQRRLISHFDAWSFGLLPLLRVLFRWLFPKLASPFRKGRRKPLGAVSKNGHVG